MEAAVLKIYEIIKILFHNFKELYKTLSIFNFMENYEQGFIDIKYSLFLLFERIFFSYISIYFDFYCERTFLLCFYFRYLHIDHYRYGSEKGQIFILF